MNPVSYHIFSESQSKSINMEIGIFNTNGKYESQLEVY